ncbi:MAG: peptide deformylase [Verrucomicrobiales bacterium]|nr:peptide deformylase [Verrucomicrobiales bacterium]|tara:strand:+ start:18403 stop:18972 length:570 start_codon:yes stop_codon:yes gene_type:complete
MVLDVVNYGHPILREKGADISEITPEIETLIQNMFETMEDYHGIGLAAQQVAQALQLTVIDISAVEDRPSTLKIDGEEADPKSIMPLVLINPELELGGEREEGPEGCLSFPDIYADVERPESVAVKAMDRELKPIEFTAGGLLSRCIQHEVDHLNGVLFIDRMKKGTVKELKPKLSGLASRTREQLRKR